MPKKNLTYHKKIGLMFLVVYTVFIMVGTIHYHCYVLNPANAFQSETTSNGFSDINVDFFSVCSLHQFAQTISNSSYSSADIVQSLSEIETNISQLKIRAHIPEIYSKTSPRAPPLFS